MSQLHLYAVLSVLTQSFPNQDASQSDMSDLIELHRSMAQNLTKLMIFLNFMILLKAIRKPDDFRTGLTTVIMKLSIFLENHEILVNLVYFLNTEGPGGCTRVPCCVRTHYPVPPTTVPTTHYPA